MAGCSNIELTSGLVELAFRENLAARVEVEPGPSIKSRQAAGAERVGVDRRQPADIKGALPFAECANIIWGAARFALDWHGRYS
jgi:hypothetical protein